MGKNDVSLKSYLSEKRRFADLFNGTLMKGRQVIQPEELEGSPTAFAMSDGKGFAERINDVSMKYEYRGSSLALFTLENQEYIDYGMPLRVMLEQAMMYDSQLRELKSKNKKRKLKNSDEYLSGIRKTDKMQPVIILVAYWGNGEWQGRKSIHDMLKFDSQTEMFRPFVPEYRINIVDLKEYKDSENFQTELKTFTGLYFCRNSKKKMKEYIETHKECSELDHDTFWTIANIADTSRIKGLERYQEKERIDMCNAFIENWMDGVEHGKAEGRIEGEKKGRITEIIRIIRTMLEKAMNGEEISELLAEPKDYTEKIIDLIKENKNLDNTEIAQILLKEN